MFHVVTVGGEHLTSCESASVAVAIARAHARAGVATRVERERRDGSRSLFVTVSPGVEWSSSSRNVA